MDAGPGFLTAACRSDGARGADGRGSRRGDQLGHRGRLDQGDGVRRADLCGVRSGALGHELLGFERNDHVVSRDHVPAGRRLPGCRTCLFREGCGRDGPLRRRRRSGSPPGQVGGKQRREQFVIDVQLDTGIAAVVREGAGAQGGQ